MTVKNIQNRKLGKNVANSLKNSSVTDHLSVRRKDVQKFWQIHKYLKPISLLKSCPVVTSSLSLSSDIVSSQPKLPSSVQVEMLKDLTFPVVLPENPVLGFGCYAFPYTLQFPFLSRLLAPSCFQSISRSVTKPELKANICETDTSTHHAFVVLQVWQHILDSLLNEYTSNQSKTLSVEINSFESFNNQPNEIKQHDYTSLDRKHVS